MTVAAGKIELPSRIVECELAAPLLLSEAAERAGVILNVACGGKGSCGGCAVDLIAGQFAGADGQPITLDGQPHRVLSCQTKLLAGPFHLRVPRHSLVEAGEKVVMDFAHTPTFQLRPPVKKEHLKLTPPTLEDARADLERVLDALAQRGYEEKILASVYVARQAQVIAKCGHDLTATLAQDHGHWHVVRLEAGDTTGKLFGAAVDIGTTTVVVALVDLVAGRIADVASSYNQQIIRCDDVASRISYASTPKRLEELRDLVVKETINRLLGLLVGRHDLSADDIAHMCVSGNTVMAHLFCGLSPEGIGGVPFAPITNSPGPYRAGQLHVAMNPEGMVDISPSSAAYIGGDITSDMYVCGQKQTDQTTVMVDIGTNAEIVVGNRDRLIACAAPAGPAFEGHGVSCGMRAAVGAIDSIRLSDLSCEPVFTVIGKTKPAGICGSGLIDFVAQAYKSGLITKAGRFSPETLAKCPRIRRVKQGERELTAYEVVPADRTDDGLAPIVVTERDVATLLQAKGVIYAALQIAMKHLGKGFGEVDRFYLAGGFARHIDLDNAVAMGLLPDIPRERYAFVGNGSLAGAFLCLVDSQVRDELPLVASAPQTIELNLDPDFMDAYTMAMFLP
jgi:uncharacterized 2Fe-2S/4Fe-4S cluster protein (DUF4445 family)